MRFQLYFCTFVPLMNANFVTLLEEWYASNRRSLPWRDTRDPYRIWVSEIILQQTRVVQGMAYFYRFMEAFPTVRHLAEASEDEVLRLWQGLGYYSRARNMHRASRQIMEQGGAFPTTFEEVRRLAGIGDYTASAIMSFAYDAPYAVLDGNVFRVLSRTQGIDVPIDSTEGKRLFASLADEMLDRHHPALYNQAIMDFGAIRCTPKGFDCSQCPLQLQCVAYREGTVSLLPVKQHKVKIRERHFVYIYLHYTASSDALIDQPRDMVLLHRRTAGDIWEGLYEFPSFESAEHLSLSQLLDLPWVHLLLVHGGRLTPICQGMKHQLTHQSLFVDFYDLHLPPSCHPDLWHHPLLYNLTAFIHVPSASLDTFGMPRLLLHLMKMLSDK